MVTYARESEVFIRNIFLTLLLLVVGKEMTFRLSLFSFLNTCNLSVILVSLCSIKVYLV